MKRLYLIIYIFWLTSDEAQNQIDSKCIGSTQKALTIEALKKFKNYFAKRRSTKKLYQ